MTSKTILIVDTDTDTIQKIMSTLESEDYLVFTASERDVSRRKRGRANFFMPATPSSAFLFSSSLTPTRTPCVSSAAMSYR